MPISEQDASIIAKALPTLPVERQAKAKRFLEDYRAQQAELGQPIFPAEVKRRQEAKTRLRQIFDDPTQVDSLVPGFSSFATLSSDPDGLRAREANRQFLAARSGKSPDEIGLNYEIMRAEYSSARYGEPISDDKAFFARAKAEVQREADHENKRRESYSAGADQAIKGGMSYAEALKAHREAGEDSDTEGFARGYYSIAEKLAPYRRLVEEVSAEGKAMMNDPDGFDWGALADKLLEVPKKDRALVLQALAQSEVAQEGGQTSKDMAAGQRIAIALDRGLERFIDNAATGTASMAVDRLRSGIENLQPPFLDAPDLSEQDAKRERMSEYVNLRDDLRDIINGEVNPIEDARFLGANLTGIAENIPMTLAALAPIVGTGALVTSFQRSTYNELRRENPGMAEADLQRIATFSAPFQALTEVVSDRLLFGRLPNFKRAFNSPALKPSSIAKQLGMRAGVGTVTETAEEFVQGVTPRAIQELTQALGQDVPDVDWNGYLSRFAKETPELLAIVIPMALIGAGVGQISDYSSIQEMLSSEALLKAAGYSNPGAIIEANEAGNTRKVQDLMREQWSKVAVKGESAGEVVNKAARKVNEEAQAKIEADLKEAKEEIDEITTHAESLDEAVELLSKQEGRPTLGRDSKGWYTESNETGERTRYDNREEAVRATFMGVQAQEMQNAQAMAQGWDEFYEMGGKRAEEIRIEPKDVDTANVVALGYATEDQARSAAEAHGVASGLNEAEAKQEVSLIFGLNSAETAENVRSHVSRIFKGANVSTVLHEGIHGRVRQGIESGHYSKDMLLQWVRMAERASGVQFLPTRDDASVSMGVLDEAIVDVVVSDAIGRRKDGGHFSAGLISRSIASQALAGRARAKAAGRLKTFLDGWRAFWGQVLNRARAMGKARKEGKLDEDFDAVLDDLMGMEPQSRHEAGVIQDVEAEAMGGNTPFSMGRLQAPPGTPTLQASNATVAGPVAFSISAFHGTPHKVDRFSLDQIGTGEGAQAYGWGLYFAEAKDVAQTYADTLATGWQNADEVTYKNKPLSWHYEQASAKSDYGSSIVWERILLHQTRLTIKSYLQEEIEEGVSYAQDSLALLDSLPESVFAEAEGNLYTVELDVDESELLDWDKPWKNLPKAIRDKLTKSGVAKEFRANKSDFSSPMSTRGSNMSGGSIYAFLEWKHGGDEAASEVLAKAGIKGIRYLDGQSRDSGSGTRNFVIFDDSDIKITAENGKPVDGVRFSTGPRKALGTTLADLMGNNPVGQQVDLATAYGKAKEGQSGVFIPVDDVWKVAKEQNPKLTLDDFKIQMRQMVDRGDAFMEPQERQTDTAEAGVPLANGMIGVRVGMIGEGPRFQLAPRSLASYADNILVERLQKKPELKEAMFRVARERLANLQTAQGWRGGAESQAERNRSLASLNRERMFRKRSRERELLSDIPDKVGPQSMLAYESGLPDLESHPFVAHMLGDHGRLMSLKEAQRQGKFDAFSGEWDDAPTLPAMFYAKSGGIEPDVLAQKMYDDGLLSTGDKASDLWQELERILNTHNALKEDFQKARKEIKGLEREARKTAKEESDEWFKEAKEKIPTAKEKQLMALRTLDALLSAFPAEVRGRVGGFVKLASLSTDKAREREIAKRLEIVDKEVERYAHDYYFERIDKVLSGYRAQAKNGVQSGKIDADKVEIMNYLDDFRSKSVKEQDAAIAALDDTIRNSSDVKEIEDAINKLGYSESMYRLEDQSAESLEKVHEWITKEVEEGRLLKRLKDNTRSNMIKGLVEDGLEQISNGDRASLTEAENTDAIRDNSSLMGKLDQIRGVIGEWLWSAHQQMERVFGEDSAIVEHFGDRLITAFNQKEDLLMKVEQSRRAMLAEVFGSKSTIIQAGLLAKLRKTRKSGVFRTVGRKTQKVKVPIAEVPYIIEGKRDPESVGITAAEVDQLIEQYEPKNKRTKYIIVERLVDAGRQVELAMSEMEAVQYLLTWRQPDARENMERDNWTEKSIKQTKKFLSPQSRAIMNWMISWYDKGADIIDPVYRNIYNAPLPRVKNYAPTLPMVSSDDQITPLDMQAMYSGLSAGFTKSRRSHARPYRRMDAVVAFMAHWENVAHWSSYAEVMRDMKGVLLNDDIQAGIRAKGMAPEAQALKTRIRAIENKGSDAAWQLVSANRFMSLFNQFRALKGLSFRLSPIVKQTSAILNPLLLDVPAESYLIGVGKLMAGKLDVTSIWKSQAIQRRIENGFSAEARVAMQTHGISSSMLITLMQKGMLPMALTDVGWTTAGAAIAYDYYLKQAQKRGMGEQSARAEAEKRVDKMIARTAQPVDANQRALVENQRNPFVKSMWMFASESRKALAIEVLALEKLIKGKSKSKRMDVQRIVVAHILQGLVTQFMASLYKSVFGDEDDYEKTWSAEEWAAAIVAGPINGLFVVGGAIEWGIKKVMGAQAYSSGESALARAADEVYYAGANIDDLWGDDEEMLDEVFRITSAIGQVAHTLGFPLWGAIDVVLLNPTKEVKKAIED